MTRALRRGLLVIAALPVLGGLCLLYLDGKHRPVRDLALSGLSLHVISVSWVVDHMDHGSSIQMPQSMAPGLPPKGTERLTVRVTLESTDGAAAFHPEELALYRSGSKLQTGAGELTDEIRQGMWLSTVVTFDVADDAGELELRWDRAGQSRTLWWVAPPKHDDANEDVRWPKSVAALPKGDAQRGRELFAGKLACFTCHGPPGSTSGNVIGPSLANIGNSAAAREPNVTAEEYLYESLLEPNRFIAPECAGGKPCAKPSAMPAYGDVATPEELADVLAFLLKQTAVPVSERTP